MLRWIPNTGLLSEIDQEITRLVSEQQKMDAEHGHVKYEIEQLEHDITSARKQKTSTLKALEKKEKFLANSRNRTDQIRAGIATKEAELGTDLIDQLTPQEKVTLLSLNPEIMELKEKLLACKTNGIEIETRKEELETNLSTNLVRRQQELVVIISLANSDNLLMEADMKRQELKEAKTYVDEFTQQLKGVLENIDNFTKETKKIRVLKEKSKTLEEDYECTLQDEAEDLEQLLNKRNILLSKQENYMKKIRDLGSLPSDAFDTHKRKGMKELQKMLHNCNDQLQQFNHVNKKALHQYVNFTEQREHLQKS